ncbi:MAG TPA: DUF362 domain-containing protein, partial [Polyangia bacterium]|nr:DUF362 domain-containing protein [Polyangia bacterium]
MTGERDTPTRRDFLRQALAVAAGAGLLPVVAGCSSSTPAGNGPADATGAAKAPASHSGRGAGAFFGRVARRSDPGVFVSAGHDQARVDELVQRAVADLVGVGDPAEAFRALFDPKDIVAIKVNCLAGPGLSSSPSVVHALVSGLRGIGIAHRGIWIFERTTAELKRAGFEPNRYSDNRPRCAGNDELGFERDLSFSGAVGSSFANVVARQATALINVPVLKDHDLSGVGCGMKNLYGLIHNPNRYHDNNCDPFIADIAAHPYVRDKLRLVLADALTAQYHGGPARSPAHQWKPAAVLAADDPVALDRLAWELIEEQRSAHGLPTLAESRRPPRWLETAGARGLGEHRRDK